MLTLKHLLLKYPTVSSSITSKNSYFLGTSKTIIRCFKNQSNVRTFLSDRDRVRNFLTVLTPSEKRILFEELKENPELTDPPTITIIDTSQAANVINPPNFNQVRQLFFAQALPFVGFGFLDNLLMIVAGDYIDLTIGVTLGISTMAAAGLGNAISDMAGIGSAYYVEQLAIKIGMKTPKLSLAQMEMARTRWTIQLGRAFGVAIGCIIGMFPLLFLPHRDNTDNTKQK